MILTELYVHVFESALLIGLILTWPRHYLLYNPLFLYYIREYGLNITISLRNAIFVFRFCFVFTPLQNCSQIQCSAVSVYLKAA